MSEQLQPFQSVCVPLNPFIIENEQWHRYVSFIYARNGCAKNDKRNKKSASNMDTLWTHFHNADDYPVLYLGKVNRMAICKCPISGIKEWVNGELLLNKMPNKGMNVTARTYVKDVMYEKDFIFLKWETENFYEWLMTSRVILQLRQSFIDELSPADRRYLKMHT
jgi:hypothetical protein